MDPYHYPPDLIAHLIDAIPALCRSKRDVLSFFKQAGVPESLHRDFAAQIQAPGNAIRKREMARTIIERLNEGGDSLLGARRQLIKRVLDFEDFSHCYPEDVVKAKAAVADIRKIVNV